MTSIFEQVKAALASRLPEVLAALLPGGRVAGREYVCASLQGGVGTSCATNLETGKGSDFATGESWGDVIALAAKVWNMRQGEAAQELARLYHIGAGQNVPQPLRQSAEFAIILPVPESAPQPPRCHTQHGQASAMWPGLKHLKAKSFCRCVSGSLAQGVPDGYGGLCLSRARSTVCPVFNAQTAPCC